MIDSLRELRRLRPRPARPSGVRRHGRGNRGAPKLTGSFSIHGPRARGQPPGVALAHDAQGHRPPALESLAQAFAQAPEPDGYVRLFLDEGAPMIELAARRHRQASRRPRAAVVQPRRIWRS